ncbi:hypothetical protein L873DRAFT_1807228 [Choiromyces venosus 120613-1]|uniref:Uncharacterized protein n=1 Tax=Choiromyces venosus 120613-1 TaxID=1336337 RepID=A0A3N4JQD2_9PEZI|nr:hypothetical protein L873DRAFT_1807228 [Choiromyces venosus 120613-1]
MVDDRQGMSPRSTPITSVDILYYDITEKDQTRVCTYMCVYGLSYWVRAGENTVLELLVRK